MTASLGHIIKLIAEGEKEPGTIRKEFWDHLHEYIARLEEEAQEAESIAHDEDKEIQEETPIQFNFGGVEQEFETTEELVKTLMMNREKARNDFEFMEWYIKAQIQNLDLNTLDGYKKGIKNSTIQRARREVVDKHPELEPDEEVKKEKERKEEEVRKRYSSRQNEDNVTKVNNHD